MYKIGLFSPIFYFFEIFFKKIHPVYKKRPFVLTKVYDSPYPRFPSFATIKAMLTFTACFYQ